MLQLMQKMNTKSLDKFQEDILDTAVQHERSDAIPGGMGVKRNVLIQRLQELDSKLRRGCQEADDRVCNGTLCDVLS